MIPHTAGLVVLFDPIVEHQHIFHSHGGNIVSFFLVSTFTSNDSLCSYFNFSLFPCLCLVLIMHHTHSSVQRAALCAYHAFHLLSNLLSSEISASKKGKSVRAQDERFLRPKSVHTLHVDNDGIQKGRFQF